MITSLSRTARLGRALLLAAAFAALNPSLHAADQSPVEAKPAAAKPIDQALPMVEAAGLAWNTDYYAAYREADRQRQMLLVNVTPAAASLQSTQLSAEDYIARSPQLQAKLAKVVRLRVPADAMIDVDGTPQRLLGFAAFAELHGGPGFLLIDLANNGQPYHGHTVSVLPYSSGKYYHWSPSYLSTILDLPPGTLSQRTMIWAVRIHPEAPQSTYGELHPVLASGAAQQASYQANVQQQGHQNFGTRFHSLSAAAGGSVSEVCAESWPGQNLIDSCIDCVDSWRHSSGHWQGVSRPHRAFGYDIRRGRNGIWYGTGIFAD